MSKHRTNDIEGLAAIFKALSNPQRLKIFLRLTDCCVPGTSCRENAAGVPCCVGDLGEDLRVSASTLSHHLKELRHAGLMQVERRGRKIECWVSEGTLHLLAAFFRGAKDRAAGGGSPAAGKGDHDGKGKK